MVPLLRVLRLRIEQGILRLRIRVRDGEELRLVRVRGSRGMAGLCLPCAISQRREFTIMFGVRDKGPLAPTARAGAEVVHVDLPLLVQPPGLVGPKAEERVHGEREVVRAVVAAHREGVREIAARTGQHG